MFYETRAASNDGNGIWLSFSSRNTLTGVLYGTAADGRMAPLAIAQSAAFLEPGTGTLELVFDHSLIAESQLAGPYEVRDLRLFDQSRMGVLHRQARALAQFEIAGTR